MTLFPSSKNKDFWDELTPSQKKDILIGLDDLKAGRKKPLSVVMSKYK